MINKVSQIFITGEEPMILPPLIQEAIQTVKKAFSSCSYTLYDKEKLEELIRTDIGKDAHNAFLKLKPYAGKADLGRFCIAYLMGGWYIDISIKILKRLSIGDDFDLVAFIDQGEGAITPGSMSYPVQNSLFYTKAKSPIFAKAIELIIENCKNETYGLTPCCPSGTAVLGRSIAFYGAQKSHIMGHFTALTPSHKQKNRSYILPSGDIFALHKDAWMPQAKGGDIKSLGAKGTNNYIDMYHAGDFYDENIIM